MSSIRSRGPFTHIANPSAWVAAVALSVAIGGDAVAADSAPGKRWQDPLDIPASMSRLAAITQLLSVAQAGSRLVAVGWRGNIVLSEDGGTSWEQVASPVSVDLTAVSFVSPQLGWAVGHGGVVLHSRDGGLSWIVLTDGRATAKNMVAYFEKMRAAGVDGAAKLLEDVKLNTKSGADQPWLDVRFVDASTGWATGPFGMFVGTRDGGRSWTPLQDMIDNPDVLHLTSIASMDGDLYIASEQGIVFRKLRDAARFTRQSTDYKGTLFGVIARNGVLIAFGMRGSAYRSTDRGQTWQAMKTGVESAITGGQILPDGRVLLVSQAGELLTAQQGAMEFARLTVARTFLFAGVTAAGPRSVVIVGTGGAFVQPIEEIKP